jgi:hypothetical protein
MNASTPDIVQVTAEAEQWLADLDESPAARHARIVRPEGEHR